MGMADELRTDKPGVVRENSNVRSEIFRHLSEQEIDYLTQRLPAMQNPIQILTVRI
jgi:hypothetical protein